MELLRTEMAGSRLPNPLDLIPELRELTGALYKVTGNGAVPQTTMALVQLCAGQIVGNTYLTPVRCARGERRRNGLPLWRPGGTLRTSPTPSVRRSR